MIGQAAMVHDLQQYVEQVGMRLFDLVEQQHAMRRLIERVGVQAALIITDTARSRPEQAAARLALHIRGHVDALQRIDTAIRDTLRDSALAPPPPPSELFFAK